MSEEKEEIAIKEQIKLAKREILDRSGERCPEEISALIGNVKEILNKEKEEGKGKLADNIDEIRDGDNGGEYFIDEKIAYLPPKGEVLFVGDIHGDLKSLETILKQEEFIEKMERGNKELKLVFLGDLSDRGAKSREALEVVLALKIRYPENITLLRGNHEEKTGHSSHYRLEEELEEKFKDKGREVFSEYVGLFEELPGVLVTGNKIVAVHAGIPSRDINSLKDLNNEEILEEMRWNDPNPWLTMIDINENGRGQAGNRGVKSSREFGEAPFYRFMNCAKAELMITSHQHNGLDLIFSRQFANICSTGGDSNSDSGYHDVTPYYTKISLEDFKMGLDEYDDEGTKMRWDSDKHFVEIENDLW